MEWNCFVAISAYILSACDPALGDSTIINVTLVDGLTPNAMNEGRVVYLRSDTSTWESPCGDAFGSQEASVVCRQLGYPGVNRRFGTSTSISQHTLNCDGEEENLANCSIGSISSCFTSGGVICYESGYTGCYPYPASAMPALEDLQTPCENGLQDSTIPNCVSLCHASNENYTYAGWYQGNVCLCGKASTTINQFIKVADRLCSSSCTGMLIETCGGANHIALFNITLYLQNANRIASPPGCAESTPTQTEGAVTTTVSIQSSSSTSPPATPPATQPPKLSTTPPTSSPPPSSPSSPPPTSPLVPSTDRTTMEVMPSDVTPRSRTPTGMPATTTRTTQTGVQGNIGLYIGAGAGGGILLLIIIILLVVFIIRRRRKVPTRTKENEPDPYMDLQPRPETDRTYQEMAITSTASSPKNRRKSSTIIKPVL